MYRRETASPWRWPTRAGTGSRRCRWASCAATTRSCAATTASATTPTAARRSCRRRRRSTRSATVHSLPGGRAAPLRVGVAGRPGARRPGPGAGHALERRPGVGRRRQDDPRQLQLPADRRQPDGPHPRAVRARVEHRARLAVGVRLRGHPRRRHGDGHQVDAGHRAAAVLEAQPAGPVPRLRRPGRPLADHPLHGAVDVRHRRRRGARRAPAPRRATAARASPATCSTP